RAGLVAAVVTFLGPASAPVSQTAKAIYALSGAGAEPAYGQIEPVLGYQIVDHVRIAAYQAGYAAPQAIHAQVQIGGFTSCANAGTYLADLNGVVGQISLDIVLMPALPNPVLLSSGTFAGGICTLTTASTFSVTTAMT